MDETSVKSNIYHVDEVSKLFHSQSEFNLIFFSPNRKKILKHFLAYRILYSSRPIQLNAYHLQTMNYRDKP